MTDTALKNPIVTAVQAVKSGNDIVAVGASNPMPVITKPEVVSTVTGTIGALNDSVTIAVTSEFKTVSISCSSGNLAATVRIIFSLDGGNTYSTIVGRQLDVNSNVTQMVVIGATAPGKAVECAIPIGATHIKALCTSYTSGSSGIRMILSSTSKVQQSIVALDASDNRLGFVAAAGITYTDTTTALGSSATFTSTTRDLTGAISSGNAFSTATAYAKTTSICVVQDVAFTLQLLGSTDNFGAVSEIYRSITATAVGSNYVAEVDSHSSAWRYFQYKIVNGASAAARTRGVSKFLAN